MLPLVEHLLLLLHVLPSSPHFPSPRQTPRILAHRPPYLPPLLSSSFFPESVTSFSFDFPRELGGETDEFREETTRSFKRRSQRTPEGRRNHLHNFLQICSTGRHDKHHESFRHPLPQNHLDHFSKVLLEAEPEHPRSPTVRCWMRSKRNRTLQRSPP